MAGGRLQHNPDVPGWQAPFTSYFAGFFAEPPGATTLEAKASRGPSAQWGATGVAFTGHGDKTLNSPPSEVQTSDPHELSYIACQRIGKPGPERPSALNHLQPVRSAVQLWLTPTLARQRREPCPSTKLSCPAVSPETPASGHAELHSCSTSLATDTHRGLT